MRVWRHRGHVYVRGPGPDDDAAFARTMTRGVSSAARYHKRHKRWTLPLAHDTVEGLVAAGLELPEDLEEWRRQQEALVVARRQANELKTSDPADLRRRLEAAGVRFREDEHRFKDHQIVSAAYALRLPYCGLFLDTGTGKTATVALVIQARVDLLGLRRCLVIAPKSLLVLGWGRDLDVFSWLPWTDLSDPPAREPVTTCPVCRRTFKRHVTMAHMKTHMRKFIDQNGPRKAAEALYRKFPELMPPGRETMPVYRCSICGADFDEHVSWPHVKEHFDDFGGDARAERAARENFYVEHPEHMPLDRLARHRRLTRALEQDDGRVFLIGPEGVRNSFDELMAVDWDMVVVDESSLLKSPRAQITNMVIDLASSARSRVALTATPRPNSSLDLWGQGTFIDHCLGGDFYRFRETYFHLGYDGYSWLPKADDVDERIWSIIADRSVRVRLEDCVELEGENIRRLEVELDGRLAEHYREMVDSMTVHTDDGRVIRTHWNITQANKLAQITGGFIFDDDRRPVFLGESPKITASVDLARRLIEGEDRQVVIWIRFQPEAELFEEMLSSYGVSTGHGKTRDIVSSVDAFTSGRHMVMVAHPQSVKYGHTWTNCNAAIFHSYGYSWEALYQAKRRLYRMGQRRAVTYHMCVARRTVDEVILNSVFEKERGSDAVVDQRGMSQMAGFWTQG